LIGKKIVGNVEKLLDVQREKKAFYNHDSCELNLKKDMLEKLQDLELENLR